jgi:hypothetical protein
LNSPAWSPARPSRSSCLFARSSAATSSWTSSRPNQPASNDRLDRFGALLLGLIFGLLAWRTVLGGLNSYNTHSETQILGFPEWTVYAAMVPPFVLTA